MKKITLTTFLRGSLGAREAADRLDSVMKGENSDYVFERGLEDVFGAVKLPQDDKSSAYRVPFASPEGRFHA